MPFTIVVLYHYHASSLLTTGLFNIPIHYPHPPTLWYDMLSPIAGNEFCQEVVYNALPPIKANLNSGVAITETISCKEYQYYTMDGDAYY